MSAEPVYMPRETVNDDRYVVIRLPVANGSRVERGELIAVVETSKASIEIESPVAGYFFTQVHEGQEVLVGGLVALISDGPHLNSEDLQRFTAPAAPSSGPEPNRPTGAQPRVSRAAATLIARNNLDVSLFSDLDLVRRDDVERVLARAERKEPREVREADSASLTTRSDRAAKVVIIGGGGHARTCIDLLRLMKTYDIVGIVDPELEIGTSVLAVPVIGRDTDLPNLFKSGVRFAVIGLGAVLAPKHRASVFARVKDAGFLVPNLIHPSAVVEASATLGEGNQVMGHATVGSGVTVGSNCIINTGAIVSHDCVLGDNVHLSPGAVLAGGVTVGDDTLIGMNVTVYLGVSVGRRVIVANGLDVFADVSDETTLRHDRPHRKGTGE